MASPFDLLPQGIPLAELVALTRTPPKLTERVGDAVLVLSPAGMQRPRILEKTRTHDLVPNDTKGAVFVVPLRERSMFKVGRAASNDVVINDVTLSKLHAFIRVTDGKYVVEDGGSKNGTFVADEPVPPRGEGPGVPLPSPVALRFGSVGLRFMTVAHLRDLLEDELRRH